VKGNILPPKPSEEVASPAEAAALITNPIPTE
jgi:hypothetical protein